MKKLLYTVIGLILLTGCTSDVKKYSSTATDLGFNTIVSFIGYTENEATFKRYDDLLRKQFLHYDKLFDKYTSYENINNIKTINDNAGKQPIKVEKELIELLKQGKAYATITNNQFDITMGSVLNIWHDYREAGILANQKKEESKIPPIEVLEAAKKNTGWQYVELDENSSTVYITNKNVSLDVGGSAKGFAVELVAQKLEKAGLKHGIINGGGNIRLIGNKPNSDHWQVGIQIPNLSAQATDSLLSITIDNSNSFVTSGDYQRYYMYDEKIYHHIIDPRTLQPARYARAVTVITKDSGIADILSTSLYTLSYKDGIALLKKLKETYDIQADAVWVYDNDPPQMDEQTKRIHAKGYTLLISEGLQNKIVE